MLGRITPDRSNIIAHESVLASSDDDYSNSFVNLRSRLTDHNGVRLIDFVRGLEPKYWRVYFDIGIGYAALIAIIVLVGHGQSVGLSPILLTALGAVLVGYWLQYLSLFIHEAAHWNLTAKKKSNDLLCNLLISWLIGVEVAAYRKVHFPHHRSLGTVHDTEHSYFFPLNLIFIAKTLFGVRSIQTILSYRRTASHRPMGSGAKAVQSSPAGGIGMSAYTVLVAGLTMHGLIVGSLWWFGLTAAAAAWVLGVGAILPFFGSLRQLLEHRCAEARSDVDYSKTDQGACARIFGSGVFASTFGSAGFNRHLLHHWEPQVSYTRLCDLERFLAGTPMRVVVERRRTSYGGAFRKLFSLY